MKRKKDAPTPFMGTVRLGPKGQIVVPKEVREMFGLEPGDTLVLLAHPRRGIALERPSVLTKLADAVFDGRASEVLPAEDPENAEVFAGEVRKTLSGEEP